MGAWITGAAFRGTINVYDGLRQVAVVGTPIAPDMEQIEREARLIAAAQDLVEALRPFAECAEQDIGESESDADTFRNSTHNRAPKITVGDLRRARAAFAKATEAA